MSSLEGITPRGCCSGYFGKPAVLPFASQSTEGKEHYWYV